MERNTLRELESLVTDMKNGDIEDVVVVVKRPTGWTMFGEIKDKVGAAGALDLARSSLMQTLLKTWTEGE